MFYHVTADSLAEGIERSMRALDENGHQEIRENQNRADTMKEIQLVLDVTSPLSEPFMSKAMPCDINAYVKYEEEFIDGTSDDLGWKYTYHSLYVPFYDKVIAELRRNAHTRRAVIALGQGDINFTEDPPCLQLLAFYVVNDRLEINCVFRSNDGVKAFPMNIEAIAALQRKVAEEMELPVGPLHYVALNFHAYSKDFSLLDSYIKLFDKYDSQEKLRRKTYSYREYEEAMKKLKESK